MVGVLIVSAVLIVSPSTNQTACTSVSAVKNAHLDDNDDIGLPF